MSTETECVIGIDKGTSMVKAVAFDSAGRELSVGRRRINSLHPHPGRHEEDPDLTWELTCEAVREALAGLPAGTKVMGIGVTAHMGGAWLIDADGRPVRNAICWPDGRAHAAQAALGADGLARFFEISGNAPMPGVTVMVLRHLLREEPEVLDRATHVLIGKDFIRHRLTGGIATDPSDVSWIPGDAATSGYSEELFALCELESVRELFPPILASGEVAGEITPLAAEQTGLPVGTPVVTGLADGPANATGTGVLHAGQAVTVLGTSCLNEVAVEEVELEPFGLGFLWTLPNLNRIRVLPNTAGTMSIDWMLHTACSDLFDGESFDFDEIERMVGRTPPGSGGVVFIPYLNEGGVLAPFFDPLARGTLYGVSGQTTRAQLARAAFEGLAFAIRDCYEAMPVDRLPDRIRVTGGGAASRLLCQMVADLTGNPAEVLGITESGAAGVAMLAAVATGMAPDLDTVAEKWCRPEIVYEPDASRRDQLEEAFRLYGQVRDATRPLSQQRRRVEEAGESERRQLA